MKKTLSLILAGLMTIAMGTVVFAEGEAEDLHNIKFEVPGMAADVEWVADGVWTEGEYGEIPVKNTWMSGIAADAANTATAKNLEYTLGMSWDSEYIYGYVQFYDENGHDNTWGADPGQMWQSGAMQINYAEVDAVADARLEYGIGLTSDTNEEISFIWADLATAAGYAAPAEDFIVINDGDTMTYEFRTPFSAFSTVAPKEGAQYGLCYIMAWGNGTDYLHSQLAQGCSGFNGKAADDFADITLGAAIVVETEAEVVEDVAAPQTFDAGVIAAVAAIVSAAGYAISKKR